MKQIDFKSIETLEYPKIIEQLSTFTVSDLGKKNIKDILPSKSKRQMMP